MDGYLGQGKGIVIFDASVRSRTQQLVALLGLQDCMSIEGFIHYE